MFLLPLPLRMMSFSSARPPFQKEQTVHTLHYPPSRVYRVVIGVDAILFLCDAISKVKAGLFHSSVHSLILSLSSSSSRTFSHSHIAVAAGCYCLLTVEREASLLCVELVGVGRPLYASFWGVDGARLFALTFSIVLVLACSLSLASFFSLFPPDIKQKHFFFSVIS